jgi:crossover junction endodeoxyribonuclease RuvC
MGDQTIIGIDPGAGGAIAVWHNGELDLMDMPTVEIRGRRHVAAAVIAERLKPHRGAMAVLEQVQGVQGTGATSAFSFGRSAGIVEGVLAGLGIATHLVRPQLWTREMGVSRDKGHHRAAAQQLWPQQAAAFARVKDDGRADAALLVAWWARRGCATQAAG